MDVDNITAFFFMLSLDKFVVILAAVRGFFPSPLHLSPSSSMQFLSKPFLLRKKNVAPRNNYSCIVGALTNIDKSHTQIA